MKEIKEKIIDIIVGIPNFYPLEVIDNPENLEQKELFIKIVDNLKELLKDKENQLERFAWIWGHIVFENTRKTILKAIIEEFEENEM